MKRAGIEGTAQTAVSNTINPKNTMNKKAKLVRLEGKVYYTKF
jgi:hypothetical protein